MKEEPVSLRLVRLGIYALAFTPLFFWTPLQYYFESTKTFFIMGVSECIFVFFVWSLFLHPPIGYRANRVGKALVVFLLVLSLSAFFGSDPVLSFWGSLDRMAGVLLWIHLVLIFFVVSSVFRTAQDWKPFFLLSTIVGVLVSTVHLFSFAGIDLLSSTHSGSTIGNSTFFGAYLLFQICFSLVLATQSVGRLRVMSAIATAVLILALFLSTAQASIGAFLGSLVLFLSLFLIVKGKTRGIQQIGWCMLGILGLSFLVALLSLADPTSWIRETFVSRSNGGRFVVWNIAWQALQEHPWLGWGLENFQTAFFQHYDSCLGSLPCGIEVWYDRAHNIILDVLVASGLMGLFSYLSIFALTLWTLWRSRFSGVIPLIVICALAGSLVQNLTGFDDGVTLLFWILLLSYAGLGESAHSPIKPVPVWFPMVATVVLPFGLFFSVIQPVLGNLAVDQVLLAQTSQERLSLYERAVNGSLLGIDMRRWYLARQTAGKVWKDMLSDPSQDNTEFLAELSLSETALVDTTSRAPNDLIALLHLGLLYHTEARFFNSAKFQDAETVLKKAIDLNPRNPHPLWALAAVFLDQSRIEEAVALTQAAVDLDPSVLESQIQRLIAVKFLGDQELFLRYANEAYALSSSLEDQIRLISNADVNQKRAQLIFELY